MLRFSRNLHALALAGVFAATPVLVAQNAAPVVAPSAQVVDPSLAAVDSMLAAAYPAGGPGAAVIVARGDRVLMRKAYGMADIELGVPMRPEHVFRLGSITKQFTAVATLMLADEGKLSLDDDITMEFERDASGAVTRLMLTQGGRTQPAPKIK